MRDCSWRLLTALELLRHMSTLVLRGIAAGRCKTHWASCAERRIGLQKLQKSWEAVQRRSSPEKWLLREEVAERRGASAKRSLRLDKEK